VGAVRCRHAEHAPYTMFKQAENQRALLARSSAATQLRVKIGQRRVDSLVLECRRGLSSAPQSS
jgi:hypothetical protein